MDEAEFGRQLRATTARIAKATVEETMAKLGASVQAWAREAAADAVRTATMEAVKPTLQGMAKITIDLEAMSDRLEKHDEALRAFDGDRLRNDFAEMMAAQTRLEAARGGILDDILKVRDAATAGAVAQLENFVTRSVSDEVNRAAGEAAVEMAKAAGDAAREAVSGMTADGLAELHEMGESLRKSVAVEIAETRAAAAALLKDAEARINARLVPPGTLADIRQARGRPAHKQP